MATAVTLTPIEMLGRLRWRCRRGMLELDLVLAHFLQQHHAELTMQQCVELDSLLSLPDQDLWLLVRAEGIANSDIVTLLRLSQSDFGQGNA